VRPGGDRPWAFAAAGDDVHSRDLLLALPGMQAQVSVAGVRLTLWGNLPALSSFAGLESVVVLHDSRAFDLDLSLVRGRIVLENVKEKGPVRVWLRLPGASAGLTLPERGDRVALETYGRWPRGVQFHRDPQAAGEPTSSTALLVLHGQAELQTDGRQLPLAAPPGASYFGWDSIAGPDEGPGRRAQLPDWADPKRVAPAAVQEVEAAVGRLTLLARDRAPLPALLALRDEADRQRDADKAARLRALSLFGLTALDDLPRVVEALSDAAFAPLRETAVLALRHWIGEGAGRDLILYRLLTDQAGYPAPQAETVLTLLHSPFDPKVPETYETLIAYLGHTRLAVRELARWHLYRLDPEGGKDIAYDAAAPQQQRDQARARWRQRLREGKLPPK
jgi:hypothetical protein